MVIAIFGVVAAIELAVGRVPMCTCGTIKLLARRRREFRELAAGQRLVHVYARAPRFSLSLVALLACASDAKPMATLAGDCARGTLGDI